MNTKSVFFFNWTMVNWKIVHCTIQWNSTYVQLSVRDDEVLATSKILTFLTKWLPKLHEPSPSNAIPRPLWVNLLLSAFLTNLTVPSKQFFE